MKALAGSFIAFLLVVFLSANVFSQVASTTVPEKKPAKSATTAPGAFVDKNNNGVCDNHEAKSAAGHGKNFVDNNGDGKCDKCGTKGNGNGCGAGAQKGNCCGKGQPSGNGCGQGCGQGKQHRSGCNSDASKGCPKK